MNPMHKLAAGAVIIVAAVGYLAFVGAAETWQYYLSVDEAVADAAHLQGSRVRVHGLVKSDSLVVADDRRQATFELRGERHSLRASCRCALPDNLAENSEVVVEGTLHEEGIHGHKVITRCASKYNAREMAPAEGPICDHSMRRAQPNSEPANPIDR